MFRQAVTFEGAHFRLRVDFEGVQFAENVDLFFADSIFDDLADFEGITFPGPTSFEGARFNISATFQKAVFRHLVFFDEAYFGSLASFPGVRFAEGAEVSFKDSIFGGHAGFGGVTFPGPTSFEGARFSSWSTFDKTTFHQSAVFDSAHFGHRAHFRGAQFAGGTEVSFARSIFDDVVLFTANLFTGPTSFENARFNKAVLFRNAAFHQRAIFDGAHFRDDARFAGTRFAGGTEVSFARSIFDVAAVFTGITFPGRTSFQDAQFNKGAFFQKAVFYRQAIFEGARFRQHADFDAVQLSKKAMVSFPGRLFDREAALKLNRAKVSFARSIFDVDAAFGGITFPGPASFEAARFNFGAFFEHAVFDREAIFDGATFAEDLSFRDAEIKGKLRLVDAIWEGRADFRKSVIAELDWDSHNRPSTVKGVFDARDAELKSLTIKDVHFSDLADFSRATFGGTTSETERGILFEDVIFEKAADFLRADFQADVIFVDNRFRGVFDLTKASFETHAHLCLLDNRIGQLLMDREHLTTAQDWQLFLKQPAVRLLESRFRAVEVPPSDETGATPEIAQPYACAEPNQSNSNHEHLHNIYRSVESSFRDAGDRWGENEAWYLGAVANNKTRGWVLRFVNAGLGAIPSRYGVDYWRAIAVSVAWVSFFWGVYYLYFYFVFKQTCQESTQIKLAAAPEQRRALRFRPFERWFHATVLEKRSVCPWQDALFLSWRAFFKLGLGSSYPRVLAPFVYLEWFVGMYMLIHFLFVLKNTLPIALPFLGG